MELIKNTYNISFVGKFGFWGGLSTLAVLLSLGFLAAKGLNYGVDFRGGTEVHVRISGETSASQIRDALSSVDLQKSQVQDFGNEGSGEYLIRLEGKDIDPVAAEKELLAAMQPSFPANAALVGVRYTGGDSAYLRLSATIPAADIAGILKSAKLPEGFKLYEGNDLIVPFGKDEDHEYLLKFQGSSHKVEGALGAVFGQGKVEIMRVESVGPKVGKELQTNALLAVLATMFFILIYIAFRFDTKFAPGAVIALAHDVIICLGIFSFFQLEVSLSVVAALLTLVGYSINDTIVVYDRIRENLKRAGSRTFAQCINDSINQTLSRTTITALTTLFVTVTLVFKGGAIIRNFALAMTIGIIIGTYSSIFIASPLTLILDKMQKRKALART